MRIGKISLIDILKSCKKGVIKVDDFIDIMDMKQGWIQDKFEDIFEIVCDNESFEDYDNPDIQTEMIEIGIEETEKFLKRLESLLKFYNENI